MGGFGDLGEGGGFGDVKKVNLGRKWVETEDEGTSSCEKLRLVLAVLLVVAVCQNTFFPKHRLRDGVLTCALRN